MPDEHFKPCLKCPFLQAADPDPGGSTSSPFLSLPNADFGTFPLAEFRSFPAWVAFALRVRFTGAPFGLAWSGAAWGPIAAEKEEKDGPGSEGEPGTIPPRISPDWIVSHPPGSCL